MSVLQKKLFFALTLLLVVQGFLNSGYYFHEVHAGALFGGDFRVFYRVAQQVYSGPLANIYNSQYLQPDAKGIAAPFVYPPTMLLPLFPLGALSYNQAVAVWSLLPLPFYYLLLWQLMLRSGLSDEPPRSQILAYVTACACSLPFVMANIFTGQTGTFMALLFMAAVRLWDKPRLAGIAIGLLTLKPQLGFALFFAMLAAQQWVMMAVACIIAAMLCAVATLWLGAGIWSHYVHMTSAFAEFMSTGYGQFAQLAIGPYISLRGVGMAAVLAASLQAAISVMCIAIIIHIFRKRKSGGDMPFALLACASLLAVPYALCYDTPLLAVAFVPLLVRTWRNGWNNLLEILIFTGLIALPYVQPMVLSLHMPFATLALGLFFIILLRRYRVE